MASVSGQWPVPVAVVLGQCTLAVMLSSSATRTPRRMLAKGEGEVEVRGASLVLRKRAGKSTCEPCSRCGMHMHSSRGTVALAHWRWR